MPEIVPDYLTAALVAQGRNADRASEFVSAGVHGLGRTEGSLQAINVGRQYGNVAHCVVLVDGGVTECDLVTLVGGVAIDARPGRKAAC